MFSSRNAKAVIAFVFLLLVPFASWGANQRKPLEKPKTVLPRTAEPVDLGLNGTVQYYPEEQFYVFTLGKSEVYFELDEADVIVYGSVEASRKRAIFRYQYTLENLPTNRQNLRDFGLKTPVPVSNPTKPDDGWDVSLYPNKYISERIGISWGDLRHRSNSIPPPMPYVTSGQETMKAVQEGRKPRAIWSQTGIPPGQTQGGFSFESSYLPGILECTAYTGRFMTITYGWAPPLMSEEGKRFLQGKTVGPVLENPPQDPEKALEQILAWVREAEELGWIADEQLVGKIAYLLRSARSHWTSGNLGKVAKELDSLLALAEAEKETRISSELYAILKYNSEALRAVALAD